MTEDRGQKINNNNKVDGTVSLSVLRPPSSVLRPHFFLNRSRRTTSPPAGGLSGPSSGEGVADGGAWSGVFAAAGGSLAAVGTAAIAGVVRAGLCSAGGRAGSVVSAGEGAPSLASPSAASPS